MHPTLRAVPKPPPRQSTLVGAAVLALLLACSPARAQVFAETEIRDPMEEFPLETVGAFPSFFHFAPLGDLDDDGYRDFAISDGVSQTNLLRFPFYTHGAVWIAFMTTSIDGPYGNEYGVRHRRSIEPDELRISTPYVFGHAVAGLGDLDGDGNAELAVSSWSDGRAGTSAGGDVYVLFLNDDGSARRVTLLSTRWSGRWGRTMTFMGDLNGDGIVELAVSTDPDAPGDGPGVVIVSIGSDGSHRGYKNIAEQIKAYHDYEADWTYLANAGDINGDGVDDLVSGDIHDQDPGAGEGAFYVVFLNDRGDVISVHKQRNIEDNLAGGGGDKFGYSLAPLGDIDGDGVPDLLVGAPEDDLPCTRAFGICPGLLDNTGAVWVLAMNRDGSVKQYRKQARKPSSPLPNTGWALSTIARSDGHGPALIGVMSDFSPYQFFGVDRRDLENDWRWGQGRGSGEYHHFNALAYDGQGNLTSEYRFGAAVEPLDDAIRLGISDVVVAAGTPDEDEAGISAGAVYLLYLKQNPDESVTVERARKIVPGLKGMMQEDPQEPGDILPPCRSRDKPDEESDWKNPRKPRDRTQPDRTPLCSPSGLAWGDRFGQALALLDDLDGDGVRDLAVGAPGNGGAVWILGLETSGRARVLYVLDGATPGLRGAVQVDEEFGHALAHLGDLDGDGAFELAVGLPGKDAVYILSIDRAGAVTRLQLLADGTGGLPLGTVQNGSRFGNALGLADVTGDGRDELLVGAPLYNDNGPAPGAAPGAGAVYALSLNAAAQVVAPVRRISSSEGMTTAFGDDAPRRGNRFGWSVAGLGDENGDGRDELIIGAPNGFGDGGAVYIVHLDADVKVSSGFLIAEGKGGLQGPLTRQSAHLANAEFGASVSPVVLKRDGLLELLVGAEGGLPQDEGAVWVLRTQLPADEAMVGDPIFEDQNLEAPGSGQAAKAGFAEEVPGAYVLEASYPNPFNPHTRIRFALPVPGAVRVEVFDVIGRSVRVLANGPREAGWHEVHFDGTRLPSGTYFYRLSAGSFSETKQMVLLK